MFDLNLPVYIGVLPVETSPLAPDASNHLTPSFGQDHGSNAPPPQPKYAYVAADGISQLFPGATDYINPNLGQESGANAPPPPPK